MEVFSGRRPVVVIGKVNSAKSDVSFARLGIELNSLFRGGSGRWQSRIRRRRTQISLLDQGVGQPRVGGCVFWAEPDGFAEILLTAKGIVGAAHVVEVKAPQIRIVRGSTHLLEVPSRCEFPLDVARDLTSYLVL